MLFPGYLKKFTVAYYLQALVPARDAERGGRQPPPGGLPGHPVGLATSVTGLVGHLGPSWRSPPGPSSAGSTCSNNRDLRD